MQTLRTIEMLQAIQKDETLRARECSLGKTILCFQNGNLIDQTGNSVDILPSINISWNVYKVSDPVDFNQAFDQWINSNKTIEVYLDGVWSAGHLGDSTYEQKLNSSFKVKEIINGIWYIR